MPVAYPGLFHCDGTNGSTTVVNDAPGGTLALGFGGTAALSTTQKFAGTASARRSGVIGNTFGSAANLDLSVGGTNPDFTVALWCFPDSASLGTGNKCAYTLGWLGQTGSMTVFVENSTGSTTDIWVYCNDTGSDLIRITIAGAQITVAGGWIILQRIGGTLYLSGGTDQTNMTTGSAAYTGANPSGRIYLGQAYTDAAYSTTLGNDLDGYFDEILIETGGTYWGSYPIARPTAPFALGAAVAATAILPPVKPRRRQAYTFDWSGAGWFSPSMEPAGQFDRDMIVVAAGSVSLTPATAALVLTGAAPTLAQTANVTLTPAVAAMALTGAAPTLAQTANVALSPAVAALILSGPAPTLARTANVALSPAAAALAITGAAPTLAQTANALLAPTTAALALSGPAPTLTQTTGVVLTPATAALVLTGAAPTLAQTANVALSPAVAALALSSPAPTLVQGVGLYLTPATAALALTGAAPTLAQTKNIALTPTAAALALTGAAPTVTQGSGLVLVPGTAALAISGPAPTVTRSALVILTPAAASLAISGPAPTVVQSALVILTPAAAQLALSGPAPVVARSAHVVLSPSPAALILSGPAPAVTIANPITPTRWVYWAARYQAPRYAVRSPARIWKAHHDL